MTIGDVLATMSAIGDALIDKRAVDEDTSAGHLIAMESAHGVLRLTMACALRFDKLVCLSSNGNCCLVDLLFVLMDSLSSVVNLFRRARWFAVIRSRLCDDPRPKIKEICMFTGRNNGERIFLYIGRNHEFTLFRPFYPCIRSIFCNTSIYQGTRTRSTVFLLFQKVIRR
jgi:hypothetical protein